jgi:hypothetical protein
MILLNILHTIGNVMSKYGKRVDENQKSIVEILRRSKGVNVVVTSGLGNGFPDLVVAYDKHNFLVEIKQAGNLKLTEAEQKFHDYWTEGSLIVATTAEEILYIIGAMNTYGYNCPKHNNEAFTLNPSGRDSG